MGADADEPALDAPWDGVVVLKKFSEECATEQISTRIIVRGSADLLCRVPVSINPCRAFNKLLNLLPRFSLPQ